MRRHLQRLVRCNSMICDGLAETDHGRVSCHHHMLLGAMQGDWNTAMPTPKAHEGHSCEPDVLAHAGDFHRWALSEKHLRGCYPERAHAGAPRVSQASTGNQISIIGKELWSGLQAAPARAPLGNEGSRDTRCSGIGRPALAGSLAA